jgi:predicted O-methyltransferase YrrM
MKKFEKVFTDKTDKVKDIVYRKYKIQPSNNVCLLINELIRLDKHKGIYLELGTFRGSTLLSCAEACLLFELNTNLFGLDTFEGFPENIEVHKYDHPKHFIELFKNKLITESHYKNAALRTNDFTSTSHLETEYFKDIDQIFDRVKNYDNVSLVKSEIRYSENLIFDPIKVLFFDCDLYDSYMDGLNIFYDKVISGGSIIFDEYYSYKYPGAIQAVIDFFKDKEDTLLKYRTQEGFERVMIIKK